jgi:hypothetical protein
MDLEQYGGLEVSQEDEQIAPGKYVMQYLEETEIRNDSGWIGCRMTFQIQGPKHQGRLVSGLFTVANPNSPKSVEIGKTELSALASSCGLTELKNTEQLKGIRFNGVVKINDNNYAELDPAYGKNFSRAEQGESIIPKEDVAEPKPIEVDPLDSEEIPF